MATSLALPTPNVQKRGYECEFVQPPPSYLETECFICLLVLRVPQLVSCCGHNFCKECINVVRKKGNSCPLCNAPEFTVVYNRAYDVALKQLEIYCTHRKLGCEWQGELEKLDEHLNVDPDLDKQLEGCAYVEVKCNHDGCEQSLQRHLIASHQNDECLLRPFTCVHCNNYTATYGDVTTTHWEVCERYPVSCPNACTEDTIERQNLEKHLSEECPLQEVECEFKFAGCEAKLPLKVMPKHVSSVEGMSHHIFLLARQNQRLTQQNHDLSEELKKHVDKENQRASVDKRELDRAIQEASKEVQKQFEQQHQRSNQELRKQIEQQHQRSSQDNQELHQTIRSLEQKNEELTKQVQQLKLRVGDTDPVSFTMTGFNRHKQLDDAWFSEGFYTHPRGYKLCLRVDANGNGEGEQTHVSCYVCLIRGEFDSNLKWPFRGVITIRLLNQREDKEHWVQTIDFTDSHVPHECRKRVYSGDATSGCGYPKFIHRSELGYKGHNNCQYLMNDCLCFQLEIKLA